MAEEIAVRLKIPKIERSTDWNKCLKCQRKTSESVHHLQQDSLIKFINAAEIRQDDIFHRISEDKENLLPEICVLHKNCYKSYTSKTNLQHVPRSSLKITADTSSTVHQANPAFTCSSTSPVQLNLCIICQNRSYRGDKRLQTCKSKSRQETIKQAALLKDDNVVLQRICGVNMGQLRYHKGCMEKYARRNNDEVQESSISDTYDTAFQVVINKIDHELSNGSGFYLSSLTDELRKYLKYENVESNGYRNQKMKKRLVAHYGNNIAFKQPQDRTKSEIVYSSKISFADLILTNAELNESINSSYHDTLAVNDNTTQHSEEKNGFDRRTIFETAKAIKRDLHNVKGISSCPLSLSDLSSATSKAMIPESLYCLLRWIISNDDIEIEPSEGCMNRSDERKVLSIAQDIINAATHAKVKTPKHCSLALSVRHWTRSKQIITVLNRLGHFASYDEVEIMDTAFADEIIASIDRDEVVVPSNIMQGVFTQVAADNLNLIEETIDGQNTTHATSIVLLQRNQFGPKNKRLTVADHLTRKRALEKLPSTVFEKHETKNFGKHPDVKMFVEKVKDDWYKDHCMSSAWNTDMLWAFTRLCPTKIFTATISPSTQQVPNWGGFQAKVTSSISSLTNIGYCPLIRASPTEYLTVYTVLRTVSKMMRSLKQETSVITFDLAIYTKAKEIQWKYNNEFKNTVIRLGGFHIVLNYLAVIGKMICNSGIEDLMIESGILGTNTVSSVLRGKMYNRGVRAHKLMLEAMFRLQWKSFITWSAERHIMPLEDSNIVQAMKSFQESVSLDDPTISKKALDQLMLELDPIVKEFMEFKHFGKSVSMNFAFWENYIQMVLRMLQFIRAERNGDWELHLITTKQLVPLFFSMDRTNYSRWLPVYLCDMAMLEKDHPDVFREFQLGNHSVSRSDKPFSQVWTDMALEQSVNLDAKSNGGIVGISQREQALDRWFLTCHERAAVAASVKEMCNLNINVTDNPHHDSTKSMIARAEPDIQRLLQIFNNGSIINPFLLETDTEQIPLTNLASGVVLPENIATRLLNAEQLGINQYHYFVEQRLNSNKVSFWSPLKHLNIATFASTLYKSARKNVADKGEALGTDRDIFGRLVLAAKVRQINLKEVLSHEMCNVPLSLAHSDGSLRKCNKSDLLSQLEAQVKENRTFPTSPSMSTSYIIDGMAQIQKVRTGGTTVCSFEDLAVKHFHLFKFYLSMDCCK